MGWIGAEGKEPPDPRAISANLRQWVAQVWFVKILTLSFSLSIFAKISENGEGDAFH